VHLEPASLRFSDGKAFTREYDLDTFPNRGGRILNFVKNSSFVLRALGLIGHSQRNVERVIVNLQMAADKILVMYHLSQAEDLRCLLVFI